MPKEDQTIRTPDEMFHLMNSIVQFGPKVVQNRPFIKMAMAMGENYLIKDGKNRRKNEPTTPPGVIEDQTAMSLAILHAVNRALSERKLSDATYEKASAILGRDLLIEKSMRKEKAEKFVELYGVNQPSFLLI
ncbi:MAG: hypothetical protein ABFD44_01500, partial [Anaerolineaceae bacterium]